MKKLLVIIGPTATGKTDLALSLAKKFKGELISCDSRQVYTGLDIGTGKEPNQVSGIKYQVSKGKNFWEINGIRIWMYDVVSPNVRYSVKNYVDQADRVLEDILKRGKLPIIVGGTGLYLRGLLGGIDNLEVPVDQKLRKELEKLSVGELQDRFRSLSPTEYQKLNTYDEANPRRLVRKIELLNMYGYIKKSQNSNLKSQNCDVLKIGLTAPRSYLYSKIDSRLLARLDQGLIEEAKKLHKKGLSFKRMRELGLEYGMLADFLERKISQREMVEKLKVKIHQYAKRQLVWFKKEPNVNWFDITDESYHLKVAKKLLSWYNGHHVT